MNAPILITGVPRSGTSLAAGLVHLGGIYFGKTIKGNQNNPKGFFENSEIRNRIIKPYLFNLGRDPMGQRPLPDPGMTPTIPNLRKKMEKILGVTRGERWGYKEPKILLMWWPFHIAFPEAKWVIVRREDEDILDSVARTPFMRAYKEREQWRGWMEYHLQRIEELKRNVDYFQFWSQKVIDGEFDHVARLSEFLGIEIPQRKMIEFVEPRLWKGAQKRL